MQKSKSTLMAAGAYLALVGILAVSTAGVGHTQAGRQHGPDVRVVNDSTEPVPVTLQGAAKIDTSSPLAVRDVNDVVQTPFQAAFTDIVPVIVPSGKRLVIEYVSGFVGTGDAVALAVSIETKLGGQALRHAIPINLASANGGGAETYTFGDSARLYADPGTQVIARLHLTGNPAGSAANCTLSGYLVDAP
jgi:hypothetical protein